MYNILVVVYLLFAFLILRNKGEKRLIYLILGVFMLPGNINIIPNSLLMGYSLYATVFAISLIYHKEFKFADCPFKNELLIVLMSCLLIGLFDDRLGPILGMWRGIQYYINTFLLFLYGWVTPKIASETDGDSLSFIEKSNNDTVFSSILPFTLIITIFGLITAVTKTNPILDAVGLEDRFFFEFDESFRSFRVTGANISSSVYGLFCGVLFICCYFFTKRRSGVIYMALALLFINCLLSATRAAIIPFLVALLLFIIKNRGVSKTMKYMLTAILCLTLLFPILPGGVTSYVTGLIESIVDVVGTGGEKFVGSNVDAREMQITNALMYLNENPLFGHGFGYANEVILGGEKNEELLGMESYICFIGIEYGLVYAVAIIIFFISVFVYYIKNRRYLPKYADMGISFIVMYILYLIYAWVGSAWFIVMPVLGYIAKKIYISKQMYLNNK